MLKGVVNVHGEPVVPVKLVLNKRPVSFPAVIDMGFNGYLSVPRKTLVRGRWRAIGTEKFEIATGDLVEQEIFLGEIIFGTRKSTVIAVASGARDVLVGTKLLKKTVLTLRRSPELTRLCSRELIHL
ncbi:MAG: hypothetical protein HY897_16975 [Deltaproteobacteria bacterium]|nr:hypothetical protein [Deltaproteobacteria bacterium]